MLQSIWDARSTLSIVHDAIYAVSPAVAVERAILHGQCDRRRKRRTSSASISTSTHILPTRLCGHAHLGLWQGPWLAAIAADLYLLLLLVADAADGHLRQSQRRSHHLHLR